MNPVPYRDGSTYDHAKDGVRLADQHAAVWRVMVRCDWLSLREISRRSQHPEASVSARLRDFRKARFGSHTVERLRRTDGLFLYRLKVRKANP